MLQYITLLLSSFLCFLTLFYQCCYLCFIAGPDTGGRRRISVQDEAAVQETSTFPQLKSEPHRIATDIAASILKYFHLHEAQTVRPVDIDQIAAELGDFERAVVRVISQYEGLCSSADLISEMTTERTNIQQMTHRFKTLWMGCGSGSDLQIFLCFAGDVVLELDDQRLPRKSTKYGQKYRRGMELDQRLRQLLTRDGQMAEETVVNLLQNIYQLVMSDTGVYQEEEKLDTDDGQSFDLSKYRKFLSAESADDTMVILFQLAKYLNVCARVPHLDLSCHCEWEQLPPTEYHEVGKGMGDSCYELDQLIILFITFQMNWRTAGTNATY